MFIRDPRPPGAMPDQGQGLWDPLLGTACAFDLGNQDLFLKPDFQNFYIWTKEKAAFRAALQDTPMGHNKSLHGNHHGNIKPETSEPQQHQPRGNDFDPSTDWFQNVRPPLPLFTLGFLCLMSRKGSGD
jgi:hypothetical protein